MNIEYLFILFLFEIIYKLITIILDLNIGRFVKKSMNEKDIVSMCYQCNRYIKYCISIEFNLISSKIMRGSVQGI